MIELIASIKRNVNVKFKHMNLAYRDTAFKLLDVGAGNQSASKTKTVFPNCLYYGLDLDRNTNYNKDDFNLMEEFYELDLTKLDLDLIPDNYFDYINMAHVIEHLHNGEKVLPILLGKLKPAGFFYIEYPGARSLTLPSMYDTLNFHDDPTHVRLYSIKELKEIFIDNNCQVIKSGIRRNWFYIIAIPIRSIFSIIHIGKLRGNIFWDILGFAEFLFVQKQSSHNTPP